MCGHVGRVGNPALSCHVSCSLVARHRLDIGLGSGGVLPGSLVSGPIALAKIEAQQPDEQRRQHEPANFGDAFGQGEDGCEADHKSPPTPMSVSTAPMMNRIAGIG